MMKNYEFTYLTRQDMPEDEAKKLQDKLTAAITAKNGVIVELPKAFKKRLAYRVKKQDAAYVNTILFQAEPAFAVDFKKETDTIAEILRGLIIFYDPEKLKKQPRRERPTAARPFVEMETTPAQSFPAVVEKKIEKPVAESPKEEAREEKKETKIAAKETKKETDAEKPVAAKKSTEAKPVPAAGEETKPASAKSSGEAMPASAKSSGEAMPAKPKRRTKIKAELRDIEEKLDEILK
jgi:ribosomal protein S6